MCDMRFLARLMHMHSTSSEDGSGTNEGAAKEESRIGFLKEISGMDGGVYCFSASSESDVVERTRIGVPRQYPYVAVRTTSIDTRKPRLLQRSLTLDLLRASNFFFGCRSTLEHAQRLQGAGSASAVHCMADCWQRSISSAQTRKPRNIEAW
jgi:hypothetical protein